MAVGVAQLNGSPFVTITHKDENNDSGFIDSNALWDTLVEADGKSAIMTAGSECPSGSYGDEGCYTKDGIPGGHAFTTIGVTTVDVDGTDVRLVKVRNPWGQEEYRGKWSDSSDLWTDALREQVSNALGDADDDNEGIFYMDIDSYVANLSETQINADTSSWFFDSFLMLGDTKSETVNADSCSGCTQHIIEVTNNSD